jgi:putative sterol carrier protein
MTTAHVFGSPGWVDALKIAINASAPYREAAKNWEGDFYFVVEPDDAAADAASVFIYLDLWHGECRDARVVANEGERSPEFRISGAAAKWAKVIRRETDPIKALITNMLRIKGNMAKVMRNVKAAQELVNCASSVPTAF